MTGIKHPLFNQKLLREEYRKIKITDESIQELKDHRGKVVIMDLWATWCQPCQFQMLELEKAYKAYSRDNLEILSINTDSRESLAQISDFIDQFE